jgi:SAM-dependent methyltransferase
MGGRNVVGWRPLGERLIPGKSLFSTGPGLRPSGQNINIGYNMNDKTEIITMFDKMIISAMSSKVFIEYCNDVYGYSLRLLNTLYKEDIENLVTFIIKTRSARILDFGCGTGELIRYLAEETDSIYVGADISENTISILNSNNTKNVSYVCSNMNTCDGINQKFDLILLIDTLYFVDDVEKSINTICHLLNENGKIIAYYSEYWASECSSDIFDHDKNGLGRALRKLGINYEYEDITSHEIMHMKNVIEYGEKYIEAIKQEKNEALIQDAIEEAKIGIDLEKRGRGKKFRYIFPVNK